MTLTLIDDLDLGIKGKVLPEGIHYVKYQSCITYNSKVDLIFFADKTTAKAIRPPSINART